jgi:hypothetical protein
MITDIEKGVLVRDNKFSGNSFAQFSMLRKAFKYLEIRTNPNSTEEEKNEAELNIQDMKKINKEIEDMLNNLG